MLVETRFVAAAALLSIVLIRSTMVLYVLSIVPSTIRYCFMVYEKIMMNNYRGRFNSAGNEILPEMVQDICSRAASSVLLGSPSPFVVCSLRAAGPDGCNLFVFHIPNTMTNEALFRLFSKFGNVISARIMVEKATGRSRGFGEDPRSISPFLHTISIPSIQYTECCTKARTTYCCSPVIVCCFDSVRKVWGASRCIPVPVTAVPVLPNPT